MCESICQYPLNTTFGKRIIQLNDHKLRIAKKVVNTFLKPGSSAFIGDGSSTFYIGLVLFHNPRQLSLWTNHLAIAHEFTLNNNLIEQGINLNLAGGQVDPDLMMTWGIRTQKYAEINSKLAQNVILSVSNIFAKEGPAGLEQNSLQIKQASINSAISKGKKIIFVSDYSKLSKEYKFDPAMLYSLPSDWQSILDEYKNLYIVTTHHPDAGPISGVIPPQPKNEMEWYCHHAGILRLTMKERFIEIR